MTNVQLEDIGRKNIPNFRGVYMRDSLPTRVNVNESGIVNLDESTGPGTHWVAYVKRNRTVKYFDSFGNLRPPAELIAYFGPSSKITYNHTRFQNFNQSICGQLCVKFLEENSL